VDLHIATQWLHADRDQVAACLALEPGQVRLVAAGTGGAFGAREDLTMQVHACLLALRTGRPVQLPYTRRSPSWPTCTAIPPGWPTSTAPRATGA
jgi:CO/xanthine dehydrogenase Mo-binding subunit